ncbi:hypothetical protein PSTG_00388 [Puccinia striiformis f. sp. tritici PST-78]|uniref:Uncharacterized protein n=1 Tax=Puccinia striiformis f. sp. tritici PST-78 TaxID=1165861 RepID=A0A0L0W4Y5_9BASI|nr:hypothetical protein PSTG_00388 [Puccinia striiformis f. sp. tritici PST-78]
MNFWLVVVVGVVVELGNPPPPVEVPLSKSFPFSAAEINVADSCGIHELVIMYPATEEKAQKKRAGFIAKAESFSLANGDGKKGKLINKFIYWLMEQLKDIAPASQHILISLANIDAIKKTEAFQITEVKGKYQEETTVKAPLPKKREQNMTPSKLAGL